MKAILLSVLVVSSSLAYADSPYLVSPDGKYLGNLNSNQFDPNSVSNQFGRYGSQFSPDSINNQFGTYGSQFSNKSPNNPYATQAPRIYGR
ncbi:MAG: hypothetical protein HOG05_01180 [Bacteroidetes bacterium]|jgi:hypothetical protein|nr:hypothetical protein [Bacteroidota bacterium]